MDYEIRRCRCYYGIYCGDVLIQTADTLHEAEYDLKELENEIQSKEKTKKS